MNQEQYEKATPIIRRLKDAQKALGSLEKQVDFESFDDIMDDYSEDGFISQYSVAVSTHADGSGINIDMSGACVAEEIFIATRDILTKRINTYKEMLLLIK